MGTIQKPSLGIWGDRRTKTFLCPWPLHVDRRWQGNAQIHGGPPTVQTRTRKNTHMNFLSSQFPKILTCRIAKGLYNVVDAAGVTRDKRPIDRVDGERMELCNHPPRVNPLHLGAAHIRSPSSLPPRFARSHSLLLCTRPIPYLLEETSSCTTKGASAKARASAVPPHAPPTATSPSPSHTVVIF
jgi:hypothetical protein